MLIDKKTKPAYVVLFVLPNGDMEEIGLRGVCGMRRAVRVATTLAGWLGVDEWESASRFVPKGVARVRRSLVRTWGGIDFTKCRVAVAKASTNISQENYGYDIRSTIQIGSKTPKLLRTMREEANEAGWRTDKPHASATAHIDPQNPPTDDDDDNDPDDTDTVTVETFYTVEDLN